jgi:hypothetical protein
MTQNQVDSSYDEISTNGTSILLIRTENSSNESRYQKGDVVCVFPEDHIFGRLESLDVWLKEEHKKEDWPGGFAIVKLDGMSVEEVKLLTEEGITTRRKMKVDYEKMERRSPESGRDTLRTHSNITRRASEVLETIGTK